MAGKNPIVVLKAALKEFNYSAIQAQPGKGKTVNFEAQSGQTMYKDIDRMRFVIDGKNISETMVEDLKRKEENEQGRENFRPIAKKVFKRMFEHAGAQIPNDAILEELITHCNQAGYPCVWWNACLPLSRSLDKTQNLFPADDDEKREVHFNSINQDSLEVSCKNLMYIQNDYGDAMAMPPISFSLDFTLTSNGDKITYSDGEILLTMPKELEKYKIGNRSVYEQICEQIKEFFLQLCKKLGLTKIESVQKGNDITVTHNLGDPASYIQNARIKSEGCDKAIE